MAKVSKVIIIRDDGVKTELTMEKNQFLIMHNAKEDNESFLHCNCKPEKLVQFFFLLRDVTSKEVIKRLNLEESSLSDISKRIN